MNRSSRLAALASCAAVVVASAVSAQPVSTPNIPAPPAVTRARFATWGTRVDPFFDALFAHRARFHATLPVFVSSARFEREGTLPVVVRFADAPDIARLAALSRRGVTWTHGLAPYASGAYGARVDERSLRALAEEPSVARIQVDLPVAAPEPLDASAQETRIDAARRALRAADGTELDGRGTLIVDIDSGVFIFHPSLFRADGGVFPWVDVDSDGALTLEADGVDLDRDGAIAPAETLRILRGDAFSRGGMPIGAQGTPLRPDRDWLYLDTNGNGRRDYGADFAEDTPAYGEPLFMLDDADRDGRAVLAERLYRLGTSHLRGVVGEGEFMRGGGGDADLVRYDQRGDMPAFARMGHGTAVAGILVGGVPGFSRWTGLAPGADLITIESRIQGDSSGTTGAVQRAIDLGADVILTEYAPYVNVTLDGSSEQELLLDAAAEQGAIAVSPAGNLASGSKHQHMRLAAGVTAVPLRTDGGFVGVRFLQFSLHHRGPARALSIGIVAAGATLALPASAPRGVSIGDGLVAYVIHNTTARGTHEHHVVVYNPRSTFAAGAYSAAVTLDAGVPLEADFYVGDDRNSWARGLTFERNDPSRTICHPATSDRTIAVGAYVLHDDAAYTPAGRVGALAAYTSRGPRIDGEDGIDIVAPDNPMSLLAPAEPDMPGAFAPFGGTSGAGPHVAAAVSLLRQRFPEATADDLRARLLDHARTDGVDRNAPEDWGHGRLDLAAALELTPPTGRAPTASLRAPARIRAGRDVTFSLDVSDDGDRGALRVRWDTDYDGAPDTEWLPLGPRVMPTSEPGVLAVRVEVRDGDGYVQPAVARVEVVLNLPDPVEPDASVPDGGASADSAVTAQPMGDTSGCGCVAVGSTNGDRCARWMSVVALAVFACRRGRRGRRPT